MSGELIARLLAAPPAAAGQILIEDEGHLFWVDWREEDDAIVESCEAVLKTGSLAPELVDAETTGGYDLYVHYKGKRLRVPLTFSMEDRHLTLCALNEALVPDYEVRLCIDSDGSDTLAFLPLSLEEWRRLEAEHGDALQQRFYRMKAKPNVFTDSLSF